MSPTRKKIERTGNADTAFAKAARAAGLAPSVGKEAVEGRYRNLITTKCASSRFTGSVDLDKTFIGTEAESSRWDFGLGVCEHGKPELAIWIEPHSGASTSETKTVLAKLDWLEAKLKQRHFAALRDLTDQARAQAKRPFVWLSSGAVAIRPGSREANLLASRGMGLPVSHLEI